MNQIHEFNNINTKSWNFRFLYIKEAIIYAFYFPFIAPIRLWWDFFGSVHRVSYDVTRTKIALNNEKDCFNKNALKNRIRAAINNSK